MDINFELYLTIAVLVMAIILLLKKIMPKSFVNISKEFFGVLLLVLVLRSFCFEPFMIPSGSMLPTLTLGDFVLVKRYAYGIRLPVVGTKIIPTGTPKRGDIAVFLSLEEKPRNFIKRIIGLPGDKISYHNGVWSLNGKPIEETFTGLNPDDDELKRYQSFAEMRFVENLDGFKHLIWDDPRVHRYGLSWEATVPEGYYFAMGDNRDNSGDSRQWGFLPDKNLKGKAFYIWMHKVPGVMSFTFKRNQRIDRSLD